MKKWTCVLMLGMWLTMGKVVAAAYPTITDYWEGKATWVYSFKLTQDDSRWGVGSENSVHVEVVGDTWYLFNRWVHWGNKPSYCPTTDTMSMQVRKSTDKGKTWLDPIEILSNTPGTPQECAATDGDVFYNKEENKWHYLYQCLGRDGIWNGCQAIREGADPGGIFTPVTDNPVINRGEIWSKICVDPNSDCWKLTKSANSSVSDEGTFDIFEYIDGNYNVSFHGFDGVRGYRGLAKTRDFQSWEPIVQDAILDLKDAGMFSTKWDINGPIGFGAGRIIKDKGYYYLMSEAADKNLGCTEGQNWVVGLFRSQSLNSTTWEQFPKGNPIFTPMDFPDKAPDNLPCYPAYSSFFVTNEGEMYFHTSRSSYTLANEGIYVYKLGWIGDVNGDEKVDLLDFSLWKQEYSGNVTTKKADLNNDGTVNLIDFSIWKREYSKQ